jgi:hypothetical protein
LSFAVSEDIGMSENVVIAAAVRTPISASGARVLVNRLNSYGRPITG